MRRRGVGRRVDALSTTIRDALAARDDVVSASLFGSRATGADHLATTSASPSS
jgi:predicted nucleotidyltransferase